MLKKNNSGITIITLVVTIVILLILAGISINLAIGDNGILNQTKTAVEKTKIAENIEKLELGLISSQMDSTEMDFDTLAKTLRDYNVSNLPTKEKYPIYISTGDCNYKIDRNWNMSPTDKLVYSASNLEFDGKSYIDTGVKLFNEENFNKDFYIRITFSEFGDYTDWATALSSLKESSAQSYPGFCVRRRDGNSKIQLGFGNGQNESTNLAPYLNRTFVIARIKGDLYCNFEDSGLRFKKNVSTLPYFDTPVTIGAALDGNNMPFRYFKGKISDIQIVLGESGTELNDIYAKLYDNNTLVFSNRNEAIPGRTLTKEYEIPKLGLVEFNDETNSTPNTPWYSDKDVITKVEFANEIYPLNIKCWFAGLNNLSEIKNMRNLKILYTADMTKLFLNCNSLEKVNFDSWGTSRVLYMNSMMRECSNLLNVDMRNFEGDSVLYLSKTFYNCKKVTNVNMKNFKGTNVVSRK